MNVSSISPDLGQDLYQAGIEIRETVERWTGIKVSVGIAPTKVLCKGCQSPRKENKEETGAWLY